MKNSAVCANVASELAKFASNRYFIYGGRLFPYDAKEFETLEGCNASNVNLFGVVSTLYTMPDGVVLMERDAKMAWTTDFFDYAEVIGVEYITNGDKYAACRIKLACDCGELVIDTQAKQVRLYDGGNYEACDIACEICADIDILYEMKYNSRAIKEAASNDNVQTAGDKQQDGKKMDRNLEHVQNIVKDMADFASGSYFIYDGDLFPINESDFCKEKDCSCRDGVYIMPDGEQIAAEDLEVATIDHYFDDFYDVDYVVGSDKKYKACRVLVAFGGPNIYIDTWEQKVQLEWWGEHAEAYIPNDLCEQIDEFFEMLYEC